MSAGDGMAPAHGHALFDTLVRLLAIQATDLKGALNEAAQAIVDVIGADKVDLFLHDPAISTLVAMGTSATPMGRRQHELGLNYLPLANRGRTVEVFQTGRPYLTGRADQDPCVLVGIREGLGVRSMLAVPLDVGGERRGVFALASARVDRFSEEDVRFSAAVANWVGIVAHRALLTEQLTHEAAEQGQRTAAEELIHVVTHDLRIPLTPLRGHLDLILHRARREGRHDYIHNATEATAALRRLTAMISALLDAGRLEQGLFAIAPEPVNVTALAQEVAALMQPPATTIDVRAPDELVLEADPERLRQALENLLSNALQHAPDGTPIVVEVESERRDEGTWAVVSVRDQGPGIAPPLLATLFDRFAHGSHSAGLGLGLYLARGIAVAHGGTLTVESEEGRGATFRLALPAMGAGLG